MYHGDIMNIGLDIHKTIDRYPQLFSDLAYSWRANGHTIHILTGESRDTAQQEVEELDIPYDHFFSITDWANGQSIAVEQTDTGPWMAPDAWDSAKGIYCRKHHLDIHFDDTLEYAAAMPDFCTFILVGDNFETVFHNLILDL
jgi:hypothetical protein